MDFPPPPDDPPVRIGDAERSGAVDVLRTACAEGRITLDEFADRTALALAAVTATDIAPLVADVPAPTARPVPAGPAGAGRRETRWQVGIMSGSVRRGRYRVRGRVRLLSVMGGTTLDLRHAEVEGPELVVTAIAVMGGCEIIVPPGIPVEVGGIAIMGGKEDKVDGTVAVLPGAPRIRVRAFALLGRVSVRSRQPKQ